MNMEIGIKVGDYRYSFTKEKNEMDDLVFSFSKILEVLGIKYSIVSGYVAILFGRSRLSEDIDILIENMKYEKFVNLWNELSKDFWCIITDDPKSAYYKYLNNGYAIRFSLKDKIIPNIEIKFPKSEIERWTIENAITTHINGDEIKISSIELQIAFKLYLGSEKDIEDAKYLYSFFEEGIDGNSLEHFIKKFNVENLARRYLQWKFRK